MKVSSMGTVPNQIRSVKVSVDHHTSLLVQHSSVNSSAHLRRPDKARAMSEGAAAGGSHLRTGRAQGSVRE